MIFLSNNLTSEPTPEPTPKPTSELTPKPTSEPTLLFHNILCIFLLLF